MKLKKVYTDEFYNQISSGSLRSAKIIVPMIVELVKPKSVVDVGCGRGEFLSVFWNLGIKDILGIDGDHVDKNKLLIPKEFFLPWDLEKPLKIDRQFDLAISLEVAEHLSPTSAEIFVTTLTELAPVVLFSAAIPFQGGVRHINEQWPEYWVKLFEKKSFVPIDYLRWQIWNIQDIEVWYRQNVLLFVNKSYINKNKIFLELFERYGKVLSVVHPELYLMKVEAKNMSWRFKSRLVGLLKNFVR